MQNACAMAQCSRKISFCSFVSRRLQLSLLIISRFYYIAHKGKERIAQREKYVKAHRIFIVQCMHQHVWSINDVRYKLTMMCFWIHMIIFHGIRDREIFEIHCLSRFILFIMFIVHLSCVCVCRFDCFLVRSVRKLILSLAFSVLIVHRDWINYVTELMM